MRLDRERLGDIQEAIERIRRHEVPDREAFDRDELVQSWVILNLQVIGEAARGLSAEFKQKHASIPWSEIGAMRNALIHGYFRIDLDAVWEAVDQYLPELEREVSAALSDPQD